MMGTDISTNFDAIRDALENATTLNVLGMKAEGAAHYVPVYMSENGYSVTGVNPKIESLNDIAFVSSLADAPLADIVVVFRRSEALASHLDEFLNSGAMTIWFQLGIRDDEVAQSLTEAGFNVVQDRCIMVEHRRYVFSTTTPAT